MVLTVSKRVPTANKAILAISLSSLEVFLLSVRHVEELPVYSGREKDYPKKLGLLSLYPVFSIEKDTHVRPFCFAILFYFAYFFGGLECAGHSVAYVAYFIFFYYSILFYSIQLSHPSPSTYSHRSPYT